MERSALTDDLLKKVVEEHPQLEPELISKFKWLRMIHGIVGSGEKTPADTSPDQAGPEQTGRDIHPEIDQPGTRTVRFSPASEETNDYFTRCPKCDHSNELTIISTGQAPAFYCEYCNFHFPVSETPGSTIRSILHFELKEILGSGSFGVVWKAFDTRLRRDVALKIPRKSHFSGPQLELFKREARVLANFQHPNVVAIHEVVENEDNVYGKSKKIPSTA